MNESPMIFIRINSINNKIFEVYIITFSHAMPFAIMEKRIEISSLDPMRILFVKRSFKNRIQMQKNNFTKILRTSSYIVNAIFISLGAYCRWKLTDLTMYYWLMIFCFLIAIISIFLLIYYIQIFFKYSSTSEDLIIHDKNRS